MCESFIWVEVRQADMHRGASTELVAETSTVAAMEILANFFDKGEIKHRVI